MTAPEQLAAVVKGRACVVVGAAPLAAPFNQGDVVVVGVNGGISSTVRCDVWVVNARSANDATVGGRKGRLHRLMVEQAAGRDVPLAVFLTKDERAGPHLRQVLARQQTRVGTVLELAQPERVGLETAAGARDGSLEKHALSAGLSATALCLLAGAASVRLVGFSWTPGYAYAPKDPAVTARGHEHGDKVALRLLEARYGAQLVHSLSLPNKESRPMPTPKAAAAPPAPAAKPIKVRATKVTNYGNLRRRPGDVFMLRDAKHFRGSYMELVSASTPVGRPAPSKTAPVDPRPLAARPPRLQANAADPVVDDDTVDENAEGAQRLSTGDETVI